jgi:hypothetical protein
MKLASQQTEAAPTEADLRVIADARTGEVTNFGTDRPQAAGPVASCSPDASRTIQAAVLAMLCSGTKAEWPVHPNGIRVQGVTIVGRLALPARTICVPLEFINCRFQELIHLEDAQTRTIRLSGTWVPGIVADRLKMTGTLYIDHGFICEGPLRLVDANISGSIFGNGAHLENPSGEAFHGARLAVGGSIFFRDGFSAVGELRFVDAQLGAVLECDGANIQKSSGRALNADRLNAGSVFLRNGFQASGEVRLVGAHLRYDLRCTGATFANEGGVALRADALVAKNYVLLSKDFRAKGTVRFTNANVGVLDLEGATLDNAAGRALDGFELTTNGDVNLRKLTANGDVNLGAARIGGSLRCDGATFNASGRSALSAGQLIAGGDVLLRQNFRASGAVTLTRAQISGTLDCSEALFENPEGVALRVSGVGTKGALILNDSSFTGVLRLDHGDVGTSLFCEGTRLQSSSGPSLDAYELKVGGDVIIRKGFSASGEVLFEGAHLGGALKIQSATLQNENGVAFRGTGLTTNGALLLRDGCTVKGSVILSYAHIGSTFECDRVTLENPSRWSLEARELTTGGSVFFRRGFKAIGSVVFVGSNIGGALDCTGVAFIAPGRVAFDGTRLTVKHSMLLRASGGREPVKVNVQGGLLLMDADIGGTLQCEGVTCEQFNADRVSTKGGIRFSRFEATGEVRLVDARIGAELNLQHVYLINKSGVNFRADGLHTAGSVTLDELDTQGPVSFQNADIGVDLRFTNTTVKPSVGCQDTLEDAFNASGMQVRGTLFWRSLHSPEGGANLEGAKIGQLCDALESWRAFGRLKLNNFSYGAFHENAMQAQERLCWLRLQKSFTAQPYEQAVQVLRRMGQEKDARYIARCKQDDLRSSGNLRWPAYLWNIFLWFTIGHGYQVWRALLISLVVILIGMVIFALADQCKVMVPVKEKSTNYATFNALVYSADVFLPIIDFHQESYWLPIGAGPYALGFRIYLWLHIFLGWLLTTVGVAGLTGLVKKD